MSNLIPFEFNGASVRVVEKDGEPFFVAKDVAELLGYKRTADAIRVHCKGVGDLQTPINGIDQTVKIIPERDVYRLIMKSKLPAAEQFEEWVVGTVLPSIRKNGGYIADQENLTPEEIVAKALFTAQSIIERKQQVIEQQQAVIEQIQPKADALDLIAADSQTMTVTQGSKILSIKRDTLTNYLSTKKWTYRQNGSWVAYQSRIQSGDLVYKEAKYTDENTGQQGYRPYCHITQKGLAKLAEMLAKDGLIQGRAHE